jgi:predicted secreted protein
MYFFDPYGNPPDSQWPFLVNPANMPAPEFKLSEYIKDAVEKHGYKFNRNSYNIQGSIRNGHIVDSECGELVILRIINKKMNDEDFYDLCMRLGGKKIFDIVKKLL